MEAIFFGCFLVIGFYFFVMFLFQKYQKESFWFSAFSFTASIRILVTGNQTLGFLFPNLPHTVMDRLESLTTIGLYISIVYFMDVLYHYTVPRFLRLAGLSLFFFCLVFNLFDSIREYELRFYIGIAILLSFVYLQILSLKGIARKKDDIIKFNLILLFTIFYFGNYFFSIYGFEFWDKEGYTFLVLITGFSTYLLSKRMQRYFDRTEILSREISKSNELASSMNQNYEKFVPVKFFQYLGKKNILDVGLGDNAEKEITIQFTQIHDFWSIVRGIPTQNIYLFLNSYLKKVSPTILENGGIIDKFIDNTILSIFPDDPDQAIISAIELQWEIEVYNVHRKRVGYQPLKCCSGIHLGKTRVGIIGEENRREITVISDNVNLTSRIQGLANRYGARILVSMPTLFQCKKIANIHYRLLDKVRVKGKKESISIGEILIPRIDSVTDLKIETKEVFEEGIFYYIRNDFKTALEYFERVLDKNPEDTATSIMIERSNYYLNTGIDIDFEGIHQWEVK